MASDDHAESPYPPRLTKEQAIREFHEAAAPLYEAIRSEGYEFELLTDLKRDGDEALVPLLVDGFERIQHHRVRRAIVSVLSGKWAKGVSPRPLVDLFCRIDPPEMGARSDIHSAIGFGVDATVLERKADAQLFDDIVAICRNEDRYPTERLGLVMSLSRFRSRRDEVIPLLVDWTKDPMVASGATQGLTLISAVEATPRLRELAVHDNSQVREFARRFLRKHDAEWWDAHR
jgi:hypothetical protein